MEFPLSINMINMERVIPGLEKLGFRISFSRIVRKKKSLQNRFESNLFRLLRRGIWREVRRVKLPQSNLKRSITHQKLGMIRTVNAIRRFNRRL